MFSLRFEKLFCLALFPATVVVVVFSSVQVLAAENTVDCSPYESKVVNGRKIEQKNALWRCHRRKAVADLVRRYREGYDEIKRRTKNRIGNLVKYKLENQHKTWQTILDNFFERKETARRNFEKDSQRIYAKQKKAEEDGDKDRTAKHAQEARTRRKEYRKEIRAIGKRKTRDWKEQRDSISACYSARISTVRRSAESALGYLTERHNEEKSALWSLPLTQADPSETQRNYQGSAESVNITADSQDQPAVDDEREPIGYFDKVVGDVWIHRANKSREKAAFGIPIYQNDKVESAAEGSADVIFVDESEWRVTPDSQVVIDEYIFDPNSANYDEGSRSFLRALFLFTSGLMGGKRCKEEPEYGPMGFGMGIRG